MSITWYQPLYGLCLKHGGEDKTMAKRYGRIEGYHEARWRPEHASKDTDIPAGFKITSQDAVARKKGL